MHGHLVETFRHNRWANMRLLDWCAGLADDLLDASAPGTFGNARRTLVHLVGAEERYVEYLTGEVMPDEQRLEIDGPFPGLDLLRQRVAVSGANLIELAASTPFEQVMRGQHLNGEPYTLRATTLLIQALHHAAEHRTHVMTVISQHGVDVPETDGWSYGDEVLSSA
jgi:uncharacterized damage-inducible protein DinB